MKKILGIFLLIVVLSCFVSCDVVKENVAPTYTSGKTFLISNWCGVQSFVYDVDEFGKEVKDSRRYLSDVEYLNQYKALKDLGVNVAQPCLLETGKNYSKKQLEAAQNVGIKQIIIDYTLVERLTLAYEDYKEEEKTFDEIVEEIRRYIADYLAYESLYGFFFKDEPDATMFDLIGFANDVIEAAAPGKILYVNLFPVYGTKSQFGNVTYRQYIKQYVEKVKTPYISYDNYPLLSKNDSTGLLPDFLYNMDVLNELKGDRPLWTFLQCIKYGGNHRELSTKADASFQAYSFLAYGGECIQWFTYWYPGATSESFGMPLIDSRGEKTEAYNYVKETNKEILALSKYYYNFDWKGIMIHDENGGEGNFDYVYESQISSSILKEVSGTDDVLVGVFNDKTREGEEGYMVVNFTDPGKNISNEVTLSIEGHKKALVIVGDKEEKMDIKKGKLTLSMQSGEGFFVIPY